jgi:hypothetical protein
MVARRREKRKRRGGRAGEGAEEVIGPLWEIFALVATAMTSAALCMFR